MYKQAVFLGLTFPTNKGILSLNQLPQLSMADLSTSLKALKKQIDQEDFSGLDFLQSAKKVNKTLELQFEILKDVYLTKKEQLENEKQKASIKQNNDKILALIAEQEDVELKKLSVEGLKKLLQ